MADKPILTAADAMAMLTDPAALAAAMDRSHAAPPSAERDPSCPRRYNPPLDRVFVPDPPESIPDRVYAGRPPKEPAPLPVPERVGPFDPDPPGWPYQGEPHPAHGPKHLLPRDEDGRIPIYYYCTPDEIARGNLAPPNFAVVRRIRHDGISPAKQRLFIETLAETASVGAAAKACNINRTSFYKLRNQPHAHAFRAAWAEALKSAVAVLADTAFQRAVEGVEEPVYSGGEHVGWRTRHDNRLLMFLLRVRDPASFAPLRELGDWQQIRAIETQPGALSGALARLDALDPADPPALPREAQGTLPGRGSKDLA